MSNNRHSKSWLFSRVSRYAVIFFVTFFARDAAADQDLWLACEDGGKVILMRRAPVEASAGAGNPLVRDPSCRSERNLSTHGRRQAREIGSRFSERRISVSEVFHSPFCRTPDTAKLAFGSASPADYLTLLEIPDPGGAEHHTLELVRVIGSYTGTHEVASKNGLRRGPTGPIRNRQKPYTCTSVTFPFDY